MIVVVAGVRSLGEPLWAYSSCGSAATAAGKRCYDVPLFSGETYRFAITMILPIACAVATGLAFRSTAVFLRCGLACAATAAFAHRVLFTSPGERNLDTIAAVHGPMLAAIVVLLYGLARGAGALLHHVPSATQAGG